ncbi:hypothetical protein P029_02930 [Anaplasma phagocytophilum str. Norway variant2]|uniref:Uncharacterized protein n=3 Tax=Anaplasma phagocytophilum TaxID=948 RepID=A0A161I5W9_ANAPH|nr:hypothetical protein P029_02930 [Anaplasma phagocytophilum str. Norway variant2]SCV61508.1 hypothetical protein ANAPH2_00011 [Anaplasma phagocytophilum]
MKRRLLSSLSDVFLMHCFSSACFPSVFGVVETSRLGGVRFIHKRLSSISKGVYEDVENLLNNLDCNSS